MDISHLQYPIGKFQYDPNSGNEALLHWIKIINEFPTRIEETISSFSDQQLETPYRPDGWTARQVIHHVADSHSHALMRFKWTLTEDNCTIKPYIEGKYAQLPDYELPIESSLSILNGVHQKWSVIMAGMSHQDWTKGYLHPTNNKFFTLREACAMYAWHGMHHLGHLDIISEL
ncbi:MAG: putative metal-dependent hydrolase [Saprospiraceae bacterium]